MNKIAILLSILLFSHTTFASQLRSDFLREMICDDLAYEVEETGLYTPDSEANVFPDFFRECKKAKASFTLSKDDMIYNDTVKQVIGLNVTIKFKSTEGLKIVGHSKLKRSISFDSDTGDLKVGPWFTQKTESKIYLSSKALTKIAGAIADTANIHNGNSNVLEFDVNSFDFKKQLAKLEKEVATTNSQGDDSCQMYVIDNDPEIYTIIEESEDYYGSGQAETLIKTLKKRGHILAVLGTTVEDWEESCAYHDIYIYLKNGTLIVINYDFTT